MSKVTEAFRQAALRRGIIVKTNTAGDTPDHLLQAASLEMANLGFLVLPNDVKGMSAASLSAMLSDARKIIGADRNMIPIYPGFPKQVQDLPTLTLFVEQILHYWSYGALLPNYPDIVREGLPLEDMLRNARKVRVLSASATARELIEKLATDPIALSEDDRTLLQGALELHHPTLEDVSRISKAAHNGENFQAFVGYASALSTLSTDDFLVAVVPFTDNVDQLLRVVLTLSSKASDAKWSANYELAVNTLADRHARAVRMGKMSRPARHMVIERLGVITADFKADRLVGRNMLWRGVMRAIHPYDFKLSDAQKRAADIVHENVKYRTLNSLIEDAMADGKVTEAVKLLATHQPGNLLRRVVALLRLVKTKTEAKALAEALRSSAGAASLTTLISAYNGIIAANDSHTRVTRVAGLTNTMVGRKAVELVDDSHLALVTAAVKDSIVTALKNKPAPKAAVRVVSKLAVPLVRRDAATADRILDRGQEVGMVGEGDILRIFGHWNNNQTDSGYMDIGVVILNGKFEKIAVCTWNTWSGAREWSTYSGDKLVNPGDSAPEFIDVDLVKLRKIHPSAKWATMTVQSWSGWPIADVDFIAGAMLRSDGEAGAVFDARSVATAFKPTTIAMQAVPFAVNLETGVIVWLDSSNGSTKAQTSAADDESIGGLVYDEIARPRLSLGELATFWAEAHNAETVAKDVDRDVILELLN